MAQKDGKRKFLRVIFDLDRESGAPPERTEAQPLDSALAWLRSWQVDRLARTYADFLADERYHSACSFFLSDIYGARDFSQRDRDFEHLYDLLSRFLPDVMLRLLQEAILLNRMTNDLDRKLLHVLEDQFGMENALTPESYAAAYRQCNNYVERLEQIERLVAIVREIGAGARLRLVGPTLRMLRVPAHRLGWFDLYDFLGRGYQAFLPMKEVEPFAQAIDQRERRILDRIYAGDPEPFISSY
jgi:hypothetical protein